MGHMSVTHAPFLSHLSCADYLFVQGAFGGTVWASVDLFWVGLG